MSTIPQGNNENLEVHQLRVIEVLLRERNLTKAALVLNTTQPSLSKALARLRGYFGDPLFIRIAQRMEPTPKMLSLEAPVRDLLERMELLRREKTTFNPKTSNRAFSFFVVDAGMVVMVPPIVKLLQKEAPNVHLRTVQLDIDHLQPWLESGQVDIAVGDFPSLAQGIRRQRLFTGSYLSVAMKNHPRLAATPTEEQFISERHVLVSGAGLGHALQSAMDALERAIPAENITVRVAGFTAAAMVAKQTDAITTLPSPLASLLARELDLALIKPPAGLRLPKLEISQYWHERYHRESGNQWLRSILHRQFGGEKR